MNQRPDADNPSAAWEVKVHSRINEISPADWDDCACPEAEIGRPIDPFTSHRFLSALEESGSVCPETGWAPFHIAAHCDGKLAAVMPLYAKSHSRGEFIFDYGWADAFERAGGRYYPKLQSSVPFTPVTGRRFLTRGGFENAGMLALTSAAQQLALSNKLSSIHVTFCTEKESAAAQDTQFMRRISEQFHWQNNGYLNFDDFLSELSSRKRKNIKSERRRAAEFGGRIVELTGDDICPHHWDAFWIFYQDTGARKWGTPYLTREFFDRLHATMRDDVLLILCEREGRYIAGALNFIGREALCGRYWGCVEHHSCLHFEVCYYRAINYAIVNGLQRVEAGAQGMHKLARGYLPKPVYSLHWIANQSFRDAVQRYLKDEYDQVQREIRILESAGPFKIKEDSSSCVKN